MRQQAAQVIAGRYELGSTLGEGGMARVYRATDRILGRQVAVKVLAEPYDRDDGFVERFRREAASAARLNHPNIVTVFDTGSDDGMHFIVMELVDGETLASRLGREGPLEAEEAVRIGRSIAAALAEAHANGVVHRDVKPGNVMLSQDGRVTVLDFGIARASGAEAVTRTGMVMGSASYLSPEQARGGSGDERSDLYGLGCVLYQTLTGRPPFVADDPMAALYQHVNEPVQPPSALREVPPDVEAVVLRCLAKDPPERFASAGEVEAALGAAALDETATMRLPAVAGEPTVPVGGRAGPEAPATSGRHRPRRRPPRRAWTWIVAVAALGALGALMVIADPFGTDLRGEERRARREARALRAAAEEPPAREPTIVTDELSVADAFTQLVETISAAAATSEMGEETAGELLDRADEVRAAYEDGDEAETQAALAELSAALGEAVEKGEIPADTAARIDEALDVLVAAIAARGPLTTTSAEPPSTSEGSPGKEESKGLPEHANGKAKGHDK